MLNNKNKMFLKKSPWPKKEIGIYANIFINISVSLLNLSHATDYPSLRVTAASLLHFP